jgi:hypothetical protein
MSLSRIQKTFVRLATNQQSYWSQLGRRKTKRRVYIYNKKWQPNKVTVGIINAVTGEKTTAKAFEESAPKLKKWLKLRNVRAEFTDMLLKKRSTFFSLSDEQFIDYPIIIQIGSYKAPYLIKRIQDRVTIKGKVTCSIQLETTDNIDYLGILSKKKELLARKSK